MLEFIQQLSTAALPLLLWPVRTSQRVFQLSSSLLAIMRLKQWTPGPEPHLAVRTGRWTWILKQQRQQHRKKKKVFKEQRVINVNVPVPVGGRVQLYSPKTG